MDEFQAEVLMIGAGVAGLAAAADLTRAGLNVTIPEARGRIGGRVCTVHDPLCPLPIELGGEFVLGMPDEIFRCIRQRRLRAVEVVGEQVCSRNGEAGEVRRLVRERERAARAARRCHATSG